MLKILSRLTKTEKIVAAFLAIIVIISGFTVANAFYKQNSEIKPVPGGIYIEGSVGKVGPINPLYVQHGTISHDITQLVFSGLTKYDPKKKTIVADLADYKMSESGKVYTFTIKKNAKWHDGTPVTSDDVIFTFNDVIKNTAFSGSVVNYNDYSKIKVVKLNEAEIQFMLEEKDSFFLVKTLTGILPKHILANIPVKNLGTSAFNKMPVGSGPYRFISMHTMSSSENGIDISLKSFDAYYGKKPNIPNIQMKIFSTFDELIKKQQELDAIRNLPYEYSDKILKKGKFSLVKYHLPQYVAVFINTQSNILKENKIRLALQLGTDKKSLIDKIDETKIIDTPLLEIDQSNWVYQYSVNKANGALYETEWQIPNKTTISKTSDVTTSNSTENSNATYITSPNSGKDFQTNDTQITITGTVPENTKEVIINDYQLKKFTAGNKTWSYIASFDFKNFKKGENVYNVHAVDDKNNKKIIDSITITQGKSDKVKEAEKSKVKSENEIAATLPVRKNKDGKELSLNLIVPDSPKTYSIIASMLKEQWQKIGVFVNVKVLNSDDFKKAVLKREYDLLIFGQNLGYNLDAYPYWHSGQAKEGGYNLSQFKNFAVDGLLSKARTEYKIEDRKKNLNDIQKIISSEMPALFLYSPTYYFALSEKIQNTSFDNLSTVSDRFSLITDWYAKVDRKFYKNTTPITLIKWIGKQF